MQAMSKGLGTAGSVAGATVARQRSGSVVAVTPSPSKKFEKRTLVFWIHSTAAADGTRGLPAVAGGVSQLIKPPHASASPGDADPMNDRHWKGLNPVVRNSDQLSSVHLSYLQTLNGPVRVSHPITGRPVKVRTSESRARFDNDTRIIDKETLSRLGPQRFESIDIAKFFDLRNFAYSTGTEAPEDWDKFSDIFDQTVRDTGGRFNMNTGPTCISVMKEAIIRSMDAGIFTSSAPPEALERFRNLDTSRITGAAFGFEIYVVAPVSRGSTGGEIPARCGEFMERVLRADTPPVDARQVAQEAEIRTVQLEGEDPAMIGRCAQTQLPAGAAEQVDPKVAPGEPAGEGSKTSTGS